MLYTLKQMTDYNSYSELRLQGYCEYTLDPENNAQTWKIGDENSTKWVFITY